MGEVGLDYYWRPGYHEVPVEVQQESFRLMLRLARETDLAVVVHNREAHADTLRILREAPGVSVVMHAFSGDEEYARECLTLGALLSIAGPVTYPGAAALRGAVAATPMDSLVLETDAPFLPPQPWRGRPSRPAMVVETARRVAEIKGTSLEELARVSSATAAKAFRFSPTSGAGMGDC